MYPTLKNGSIVLMKKYDLKINYNDIVVIKKEDKILIKRIVGLPKDSIYIDNYLFVNEKKFDNNIIEEKGNINDVFLKENEYFVLGDNRKDSIDSRFQEIGIINKNEIIGKVLFK